MVEHIRVQWNNESSNFSAASVLLPSSKEHMGALFEEVRQYKQAGACSKGGSVRVGCCHHFKNESPEQLIQQLYHPLQRQ
jgi:hypothetical protein